MQSQPRAARLFIMACQLLPLAAALAVMMFGPRSAEWVAVLLVGTQLAIQALAHWSTWWMPYVLPNDLGKRPMRDVLTTIVAAVGIGVLAGYVISKPIPNHPFAQMVALMFFGAILTAFTLVAWRFMIIMTPRVQEA